MENQKTIKRIYDEFSEARRLRNNRWKYFNDRSLKEFIDDSQLRLNGYVPTKAEQGKENWQSNVFHPVTKNKFKAMLAAVALDIPSVRIAAQNEEGRKDQDRADIMKNLISFSYQNDEKELQIFFEAWEAAEKGTVVVYDGYLKAKAKRKVVTSYDPETGEVETDEEEVETDNQCVNYIVPLMNLYINDWTVFDIQKQPCLHWVERMTMEAFMQEYGKFPKAKKVKTKDQIAKANLSLKNEQDTFFTEWADRVTEEEPVEVVKYYNKLNDESIILANGVEIANTPLLLGKKKKWYPFAKTVFEPLGTDFFYGNSLPNSLMGEQDVINALFNMALDKTYKSMAPALLIGNANKDDFDLEDQNTTIDTKIYVQDINQVREMPITGMNQGDIKMIEMISRGLDLSSVDQNQQGVAGRGVTAREVVIANENAQRLKGILYMFLTSLWIQKMKLRIMNILIYFTQPKAQKILSESGEPSIIDNYQTFNVPGAEFPNGTKGTLGVQMVGSQEELPDQAGIDIQEQAYSMQSGDNYQLIAITNDYLDDWQYDVKVESETIFQKETGINQTKQEEKLRIMGQYFPQLLQLNTEKLFTDTILAYEDDPMEYQTVPPMPMPGMEQPGMPGMPGQQTATAGQTGMKPLAPLK